MSPATNIGSGGGPSCQSSDHLSRRGRGHLTSIMGHCLYILLRAMKPSVFSESTDYGTTRSLRFTVSQTKDVTLKNHMPYLLFGIRTCHACRKFARPSLQLSAAVVRGNTTRYIYPFQRAQRQRTFSRSSSFSADVKLCTCKHVRRLIPAADSATRATAPLQLRMAPPPLRRDPGNI